MIASPLDLNHHWRLGWAPLDRRSLPEWSRGIDLQGDYARKGFFRSEESRHLLAPMEALTDPAVRMVSSRKGIQTFGTGIGDLFFLYTLDNAPSPFACTMQSDDDASDHFATRIQPTLEANERFRPLIAGLQRRRSLYRFPRSNAYFQGANLNSLQRKSIRYLWNDEIWAWRRGMLREAFARTADFRTNCKIYNASQAGTAGDDEDLNFRSGRIHEWSWQCPSCRYLQTLDFLSRMLDDPERHAGIVWDRDARRADGRWDLARAAASTRLRCRRCSAELPDEPASWARINATGCYMVTADGPAHNLSFKWTSMVSGYWSDLVVEFLQACEAKSTGVIEPLKQFYQKKLVEPWQEALAEQPIILRTGEFTMGTPLPDAAYTFLVADYQEGRGNDGEHWWVLIRSWTADGGSRLIHYGRMETDHEIRARQIELGIPDRCVALDGGDRFLHVAGIAARYGWIVLRGSGKDAFPHILVTRGRSGRPLRRKVLRPYSPRKKVDPGRGTKNQGRAFVWYFDWSNLSVKNITAQLRLGRGVPWELPADLPHTYRDQIDTEIKVSLVSKTRGSTAEIWRPLNPSNPNNHAWDDENQQTAMALIAKILTYSLDDRPADDAPAPQRPPTRRTEGPVAPHDEAEQLTLLPA